MDTHLEKARSELKHLKEWVSIIEMHLERAAEHYGEEKEKLERKNSNQRKYLEEYISMSFWQRLRYAFTGERYA